MIILNLLKFLVAYVNCTRTNSIPLAEKLKEDMIITITLIPEQFFFI